MDRPALFWTHLLAPGFDGSGSKPMPAPQHIEEVKEKIMSKSFAEVEEKILSQSFEETAAQVDRQRQLFRNKQICFSYFACAPRHWSHLKNPIVHQLWTARGHAKEKARLDDNVVDLTTPRVPSQSTTQISLSLFDGRILEGNLSQSMGSNALWQNSRRFGCFGRQHCLCPRPRSEFEHCHGECRSDF
jgi:hypothetical protein